MRNDVLLLPCLFNRNAFIPYLTMVFDNARNHGILDIGSQMVFNGWIFHTVGNHAKTIFSPSRTDHITALQKANIFSVYAFDSEFKGTPSPANAMVYQRHLQQIQSTLEYFKAQFNLMEDKVSPAVHRMIDTAIAFNEETNRLRSALHVSGNIQIDNVVFLKRPCPNPFIVANMAAALMHILQERMTELDSETRELFSSFTAQAELCTPHYIETWNAGEAMCANALQVACNVFNGCNDLLKEKKTFGPAFAEKKAETRLFYKIRSYTGPFAKEVHEIKPMDHVAEHTKNIVPLPLRRHHPA